MTNSYKQPGSNLEVLAPYDRASSGLGVLVGSIFGMSCSAALSGAALRIETEGVHTIAKLSTDVWAVGDKIAWDNTNKRCDKDLTKGPLIGVATEAAANPSATGSVRLLGTGATPRANVLESEASPTPSSLATAGARTITAAEALAGIYVRDCAGASRIDTLPTAALLVAAVPGAKVGDMIKLHVVNGSDAAEVLTITEGAGGAFDVNQTAASRVVPQNASKDVYIRLTNVTAAAEAYVVYA